MTGAKRREKWIKVKRGKRKVGKERCLSSCERYSLFMRNYADIRVPLRRVTNCITDTHGDIYGKSVQILRKIETE